MLLRMTMKRDCRDQETKESKLNIRPNGRNCQGKRCQVKKDKHKDLRKELKNFRKLLEEAIVQQYQ